jgi:O-antigen/teichoic acid export membrane protein
VTFLRSSGVVLLSSVVMVLISLATGILLARALGPAGRGVLATVLVWPLVLGGCAGLSLSTAVVFFGAAEPALRPRLFANAVWSSLALGGMVALLGASILPRMLSLDDVTRRLLVGNLCFVPLGMWAESGTALMQSSGRFSRLAAARVLSPIITCAGLCGLGLFGRITVSSAMVVTWAGLVGQSGLTWWFLARDGHVSLRADRALFRRCLAYGSRAHVGTIAGLANRRLDQLLLTAMVTPRQLGLYAFATTLTELLNHGAASVSSVLFPRVAAERSAADRRELAIRGGRWTLLLGTAGAIGLALLAPPFIRQVWGAAFLESVPIIWLLLPGTVVLGLAVTLCASLSGVGKPIAGTAAELASLAVMVPLLVLLVPRLGVRGAALASTCGYLVNCLVAGCYFSRVFGAAGLRAIRPGRVDLRDLRRVVLAVVHRESA